MIKRVHHLFIVTNENEPALIIGEKLKPFFCDEEKVQIGRLRSEAQLNLCPQFLLELPLSCFCRQDPPKSSRRKVAAQKPLDFSKKKPENTNT